MQILMLAVIGMVMTFDYLASIEVLPGMMRFTQELSSGVAIALIIALGARNRFQYVRGAYWLVFGSIVIVIVCGALTNNLGTGPLFAGIRTYLRAIPFFFLPAVFEFSERQIRQQLALLAGLCFVQMPLAFYQRAKTLSERYEDSIGGRNLSGDHTFGTLLDSGTLSIFLICAACIPLGALVHKQISWPKFLVLFMVFLVPTMVNETKATLFMLPLALLAVMILGAEPAARSKNAVVAVMLIAAFSATFIPVYDYYMKPRWGYGIVEFLTMPGRLEGYVSQGGQVGSLEAGRVDSIVVANGELSRDPAKLLFGVGLGNASESALGDQFEGAYFQRYKLFASTSFSIILFEIGWCGVILVYVLYWCIFRDAQILAAKGTGLFRTLAVGWLGVMTVMVIATFYVRTLESPALSYLFWYFSGLIAACRMRLALGREAGLQTNNPALSRRNPTRAAV